MGARLAKLDLTKQLSKSEYEGERDRLQLELLGIQQKLRKKGRAILIGMEGLDASGKGGAIKRMVEKLDPRGVRVYAIGPPTEEELARHYLWRFWRRIPEQGRIAIFDRSWYGRVLVERIEKLVPPEVWRRAYEEINEFEETLVENGVILLKFWFQISKKEQLERFRERERNPYKRWKISATDWHNRRHWSRYIEAAEEMFDRTDTKRVPWRIVEAEAKWYARVKVLRETVAAAEAALGDRKRSRR
jgi:polyphosphate kinase 2 (PPK2 family)